MADDLSLLFRLRADNAQAKTAIAETRAAVGQLRQSLGPELAQTLSSSSKVFSEIGNNINTFVGARLPLIGGTFIRVTENLKNFTSESGKGDKAVASLSKSIESIATSSNKTVPQVTAFLAKFVQIEGQAKRDAAAVKFFGASVASELIPQLKQAGTELSALAEEGAGVGSALGAMAGPVGIAVLAVAALAAGAVVAAKELFDLSKQAAEFQGRMFDLAQQTGLSVETLSALEVVAKTTGGEIGNLTNSVVAFQRKLEEAQDPTSKAAETFRKLNISTSDTESSLRQTFAVLAAMPEGFKQTSLAAELFGARGGKQVLAILKETNGNLDATIEKLREAGILIDTDAARSADKFNDELALLDFQLRAAGAALAKDLIPAFIEAIKATNDLVRASKPLLESVGTLAGPVVRTASEAIKGLGLAAALASHDYEALAKAIKEAQDASTIPIQAVPNITPVPLPGPKTPRESAAEAVQTAEDITAAVKRNAADTNQALAQMFEQGRINRKKQTDDSIAEIKKITGAEIDAINARIAQRQLDLKSLDIESDAWRDTNNEIGKLVQQRADKEAEVERQASALRAKAAKEDADARRNQEQNNTDILIGELDRRIQATEAAIQRGAQEEEAGLRIIEALERAKIDARRDGLEKQKAIGFLTIDQQKELNDQIKKINQDADRLADEQEQRRLARDRKNAELRRDLKIRELDTELELQRTVAERLIANQKNLADLRVKSEEDAAREVLKIRLDLIDQEEAAINAKLQAAKSITDKNERIRTEAELNAQLKILTEQRKTTQADGDRDIEAGRQKDLDNARRYAEELRRIGEQIRDVQRDIAREVIEAMRRNFASQRDIVRAQTELAISDENTRHAQALETLRDLERDNVESKRTLGEKLAAQIEIDGLREAEAERHRQAMENITKQAQRDAALAGPGGGFSFGLETGQLKQIEGGIKSFQDVAITAFSAVGAAVNGLAQGVGSLVQQWVLLGTTGPAAFRKLVASVLAGVAAQAATMAIMELAYGIAALTPWGAAIYGPAPFHFKSAALFGAIAVGAGLAGRSVAGGLFQQGAGGGSGTSGGTGTNQPNQLNPLELARNNGNNNREVTFRLVLEQHVTSNDSHIIKTVVKDFQQGGSTREAINNDGVLK